LLFGFTETLRLRDPKAVHALLLLAAVALAAFAIRRAMRRRWMSVGVLSGLALLIGVAYFRTNGVPDQLPKITPYLAVLFVLLFATQRFRPPAMEGIAWSKGEH
jgi:simple sugar transport system permease protein